MLKVNTTYHPRGELVEGYRVREHPLYFVWVSMKARCQNPNATSYVNYGGRGITICERWEHFANFVEDMSPREDPSFELNRKDNDGNYCKDNCEWTTQELNAQNKRVYKTNKFGVGGTHEVKSGAISCRVQKNGTRFNLGCFNSAEEAGEFKAAFEAALDDNPALAQEMLERRARLDSSTAIKGISKHSDGGFVVRKTVNGERKYLGYAKTLDAAIKLQEAA